MTWDVDELARAFRIRTDDVKEYLTDGRRVSFIIERRLRNEHEGWQLANSEGAGWDLQDPLGRHWEVRCITNRGAYFCPSYMVGSGRRFDEEGFRGKLAMIAGYIIADIVNFPHVEIFKIPTPLVDHWFRNGYLGAGTRFSRNAFYNRLLNNLYQHRDR